MGTQTAEYFVGSTPGTEISTYLPALFGTKAEYVTPTVNEVSSSSSTPVGPHTLAPKLMR